MSFSCFALVLWNALAPCSNRSLLHSLLIKIVRYRTRSSFRSFARGSSFRSFALVRSISLLGLTDRLFRYHAIDNRSPSSFRLIISFALVQSIVCLGGLFVATKKVIYQGSCYCSDRSFVVLRFFLISCMEICGELRRRPVSSGLWLRSIDSSKMFDHQ